ncbi:hypothetical protein HJC23_010360 [Cyclotella cryptica]|uniref:Glutathione peroxidase n=1 Tax=Cyclotella cryptica TaxID=29204 RepID=A0ABD3ND78_9STRA
MTTKRHQLDYHLRNDENYAILPSLLVANLGSISFLSATNGLLEAIVGLAGDHSEFSATVLYYVSMQRNSPRRHFHLLSFMQQNCPESCHKHTVRPPETRHVPDDHEEFFEMSAKDASGKVLSLENFEGYVTVVVNGARVCDYSEVFYATLEHMHTLYPFTLEILAFPFDHPNITTDSCADDLRALERKSGRKIHVMETAEINGPNTHPVFRYLKELFGMKEMDPNFAHYFFVHPDGNLIELHYGASYNTLKSFVDRHVKQDLRIKKKWEL